MGKPFTLRIKAPVSNVLNRRKNNAHDKIVREQINLKNAQMAAAVEWCTSNGKRGWAALQTGNYPLLNDARSINRRLDGKVESKKEYESRSVMTIHEEESVVSYMKNMNRCNQGISRKDATDLIIKILNVRRLALNINGE